MIYCMFFVCFDEDMIWRVVMVGRTDILVGHPLIFSHATVFLSTATKKSPRLGYLGLATYYLG